MLLTILLLNLVSVLAGADAEAKSPPKAVLENLVNKLEFRLRDMETRMKYEVEKQAKENRDLEGKIKKWRQGWRNWKTK